ncbi:MAG: chromate transporter [Anaerovoracaceae bacterium]
MKNKRVMENLILFWEFFKVGLFTIGGGLAMVPIIEDIVVNKKKWLTKEEMLDCIALSQAVPGVVAVNVSTFIGKKKDGIVGSLTATFGVLLPSFLVILILMGTLDYIDENRFIQGVFVGIKAALVGLVVVLTFRMGKQIIKDKVDFGICIIAFLSVVLLDINGIIVIAIAGTLGIIRSVVKIQ